MNLTPPEWDAVARLREVFLEGQPQRRAYWKSETDLSAYDQTLGERIGWKWDSVLAELAGRGWKPPAGPVVDFGCGSGVAGRRVVAAFGVRHFSALRLHDRSPLAESFALGRARAAFPQLACSRLDNAELDGDSPLGTLLVSHVLSELPERDRQQLVRLARRADAVLWVEPGTQADSRALVAVREALRDDFEVIAPCSHCDACGLLTPGREGDWCHHFGKPPWEIFADAAWADFARRLGIDLRSLPYSFLVLQRRGLPAPAVSVAGQSRTLGLARIYKGYAKILACDATGVAEVTLQKREAPDLFKAFKDGEAAAFQRWQRDGDRVLPAD
jgi:hypothetical protein